MMFPLLHGYKHLGGLFSKGKEQTTKLDSMIVFVTENTMFLFIGL